MNGEDLIFRVHGRIEARHDPELQAIVTTYVRTYDPHGVFLPAGIRCGLEYAKAKGLKNWIVDVSREEDEMSEKDRAWEKSEEFRQIFRESSIRSIVFLLPAVDASGDTSWADDFAEELGADFACHVTASINETKSILGKPT